MIGHVKWYNHDEKRGFGFIIPLHGGEDVFVMRKDLKCDPKDIQPGVRVQFDVKEQEAGPRARNVEAV